MSQLNVNIRVSIVQQSSASKKYERLGSDEKRTKLKTKEMNDRYDYTAHNVE